MKERLDYIDRARGILIILMVIGHVWQSGPVFDVIYAFHMPAFFIISGMLMAYTGSYQKPFGKFFRGKVLAYGIPFIWIECLGVLTDIMRNGITLNVKGYLFNTVTFDFNDPNLWFLANLFLIEILVAGMSKCLKRKEIICGIGAVLFFVRYALPTQLMYVGTVSSVMKYLPLFLFGFYGHRYWKQVNGPAAVLCALVTLALGLLEGRIHAMGRLWDDFAYMLSGCCGTYAALCIGQMPMRAAAEKLLAWAGKNTILIFGTHHIYYAALGVLLGVKNFAATPIGTGLVILAGVALLEVPTVYVINRWLPFLTGKVRRKTRSA